MRSEGQLEPLEPFSLITVHTRARDTSIWEKGSNPSKPPRLSERDGWPADADPVAVIDNLQARGRL